jgi:hypothetical protein
MAVVRTGQGLLLIASAAALSAFACSTPIGDRASGEAGTPPPVDAPDADIVVPVPAKDAGRDAAADAGDAAVVDAAIADTGVDAGEIDAGPLRGFMGDPIRFRVPGGPGLPSFATRQAITASQAWTLVDFDGDGILDLVQTGALAASGRVTVLTDATGPYWRVFRGTATGFATPAVRFAVPDAAVAEGFFAASANDGPRAWALLDLDGDRRPELVQTADPRRTDGAVWSDASGAYWRVYAHGATAFSADATRFPVPPSGTSLGFASVSSDDGAFRWRVVDVEGDGVLDLVQSANPAAAGGVAYADGTGGFWRRFRGVQGAAPSSTIAFATTSERWAVPASGTSDGFFAPTYAAPPPNTRFWDTLDVTGDGVLDLVQTADPSVNGGFAWSDTQGQFWRVFRGEATGFSRVGTAWRLPGSGLADGFFATAARESAAPRQWVLVDLDGDKTFEIVQTADPSKAGGVVFRDGRGPYWRVFKMRVGYINPVAERQAVPDSTTANGFFAANVDDGPLGPRAWSLVDLNGDGRLDLVQTADPSRASLAPAEPRTFTDAAGAYWRVWLGK